VNKKQIAFFVSSFTSSVGDSLLYFALPIGLGIERNSVKSSIILFFVPSIFMIISSFLAKKVSKRLNTARKDYSIILGFVALLEIGIAVAAINTESDPVKLALMVVFVSIYAFAKEGLPKLFYSVAMYRHFFNTEEYAKVVGFDRALSIAAWFVGTLVSGALLHFGKWEMALLFDGGTFFVLAGTLFFIGKDFDVSGSMSGYSLPPKGLRVERSKENIALSCFSSDGNG
jgi:hypothetical protein